MSKLKTKGCDKCGGTGQVPDDNTGAALTEQRDTAGVSRAALAEAMGISPAFLRDLEQGHRNWTDELVGNYTEKLEGLK